IIKYIVKLKQSQPEIILAEFHHSAHASGYKQRRPERASLQRVRDDKSQREEKQDIVQDLHPQLNILPEYPCLIRQEKFLLVLTVCTNYPYSQGKRCSHCKLHGNADERRRLTQTVKETDIQPVHEGNI